MGGKCDASLGEACEEVPAYEEVHRKVQDPLLWLLLDKDNAIDKLRRYKELKGENPQGVLALITLTTSLSRNPKIRIMLKRLPSSCTKVRSGTRMDRNLSPGL